MSISEIRNFSIVAHIDHGKSTLADRLIEATNSVDPKMMREQVLDTIFLERERGVTIKSKTIRMKYLAKDGKNYILNLIDTPGHVDFSFEVSRALIVSDGLLLVVDASQGVEAQTVSHASVAKKMGLKILPVINKIDLQTADLQITESQIKEFLGITEEPIFISAKENFGIDELLEAIVEKIPPPKTEDDEFKGLIFDSFYDHFHGVVTFIKVVSGSISATEELIFHSTKTKFVVKEVGYIGLRLNPQRNLTAGEIGYIVSGIKDIHSVKIGDVIYKSNSPPKNIVTLFQETKPFVFADIYPLNLGMYNDLKLALDKLHLVDASFSFFPIKSSFGPGFHCGFLGLFHLEIIKERITREYKIEVIFTIPSVIYRIKSNGDFQEYDNVSQIPPNFKEIQEPYVSATILTPTSYLSPITEICKRYRGDSISVKTLDSQKSLVNVELPLAEMIIDFYDALKSVSKGYASFDYKQTGYKKSDLVKLEVLVNGKVMDNFSFIVHKSKVERFSRKLAKKLSSLIPRHLFEVIIQVKARNRIVARENIRALRKDVTAKCYGGDFTRKMKLLSKQKEGKKKMKKFGNVEVPSDVFFEMLKLR